jgi:hypothetical protein
MRPSYREASQLNRYHFGRAFRPHPAQLTPGAANGLTAWWRIHCTDSGIFPPSPQKLHDVMQHKAPQTPTLAKT